MISFFQFTMIISVIWGVVDSTGYISGGDKKLKFIPVVGLLASVVGYVIALALSRS